MLKIQEVRVAIDQLEWIGPKADARPHSGARGIAIRHRGLTVDNLPSRRRFEFGGLADAQQRGAGGAGTPT